MRGEAHGAHMQSASQPKTGNGSAGSSLRKAALSNVLNGSSHKKAEENGNSITSANGTQSRSASAAPPTFYGHDREEVIRIMIQGLTDLGYDGAANALSQESGCDLETPYASAFRLAILQGDWSEAEALLSSTFPYEDGGGDGIREQADTQEKSSWGSQHTLTGLALSEDADKNEMLFLIRQQKYLELLEVRDLGAALMVLRQELQPLHQDERHLHALSRFVWSVDKNAAAILLRTNKFASLIMCQSSDDLKYQARWDGASGDSRQHLLTELSRELLIRLCVANIINIHRFHISLRHDP